MKKVIVVPLYRSEMSAEETASLRQCGKIFSSRDIVFAAPEKLDCQIQQQSISSARIERFDDSYFTSISSYSRLLLTPEFYSRFSDYDYMLIYQLDAWVFRDELDCWCEKGYDYIGAPFVINFGQKEHIIVGNGGFSLRRISAVLRVLSTPEKRMFPPVLLKDFCLSYIFAKRYLRAVIPLLRMIGLFPNQRGTYLEQIRRDENNNEDMVFYFLSKKFTDDGLIMPDIEEAARFALSALPGRFFQCTPFGAHAWMKDTYPFWKDFISVKRD